MCYIPVTTGGKLGLIINDCILLPFRCVGVLTQDFHRKFEMEKSDRRISDSRALQLLQEVKEKGRLAQQLREEQSRCVCQVCKES